MSCDRCDICGELFTKSNKAVVPLSENVVGVIFKLVLFDAGDLCGNIGRLYACHTCGNLFTELIDQMNELDRLRLSFNDLIGNVGDKIITQVLGMSETVKIQWRNKTRIYEDVYPSRVQIQSPDSKKTEISTQSDIKLSRVKRILL